MARTLGVRIAEPDDLLFAYAQWFSRPRSDNDRYTRIEAAPHGWWYSNRLPGTKGNETKRLVVWHTDKDLPAARIASDRHGFDHLLKNSTLIAPLLEAEGYRPCGSVRGAPANSQRLEHFCGDDWLAVGDAAQAYDPLSSQGIDKALSTGSHAGHMIHYALTDRPQGNWTAALTSIDTTRSSANSGKPICRNGASTMASSRAGPITYSGAVGGS